jgi:hypothetical protein
VDTSTGKYFHLAGVVSLIGYESAFQMDWHDSLMPIAPDYTFIDKAIVDCVYAGCETIWLVCNDDMTPLLKKRLGDWASDPVWRYRKKSKAFYDLIKEVPIFYVPTHPNDINRRDCMAWGILHGAATANTISSQISKWTRPDAYFVTFPYGVYDYQVLRENRDLISSRKKVYFSCGVDSIKTGKYLPFTFDGDDLGDLVKSFKNKNQNSFFEGRKLPLEERYTGRHFTLLETFDQLSYEEYEHVELKWAQLVETWEDYTSLLSNCHWDSLDKKRCIPRKTFNKIPYMEEENDRA